MTDTTQADAITQDWLDAQWKRSAMWESVDRHTFQKALHEVERLRRIAAPAKPVKAEGLSAEEQEEAARILRDAEDGDDEFYLASKFYTLHAISLGLIAALEKHYTITKRQPGGEG